MIDTYPKCPFCGTVDDWDHRHDDRMDCIACDAIRHRCGPSDHPWEYVSPKLRRIVARAETSVRDAFDGGDE